MVKPATLVEGAGMSESLRRQLGSRLKALREAQGLTQVQLAALLGKSLETISNFERGKTLPSLVTLEQLAGALGLSMRDFFEDQLVERPEGEMQHLIAEARGLSADDRDALTEIARVLRRRSR